MSALGQKQTYAAQQVMSALLPIATAKADICASSCPLYPQKRTCAVQRPMSALGQKRTSGLPFNHLIGASRNKTACKFDLTARAAINKKSYAIL
jgi:hypothetical protein